MFSVLSDSGNAEGPSPLKLGDALGFGEAASAGRIVVPDANLLFSGDFKRSGLDLELSHDDRHFLVRDYFRGEHRAALSSSDGAWLTGDVVSALTGHTQFAQADGLASAGKIIGHVTKLAGNATVIRNGVSIILNLGDNVEKGDVVQSGSDSKLGITFIDGTVFGLASNSRMVLNEMVYDPNGSNNSSLLSLVAGTITFVAGQTAKHGDMKVDTPVATMGIRGTAVLVHKIEFLVSNASQGGGQGQVTAGFQVLVEPDGSTGSYILMDRTTFAPLATVNDAGKIITYNQGVFGTSAAAPLSAEIQQLITDVFALKFTDTNPKTLNQFTDSIVPDGIPHTVFASDDGNPSKYSVGFGQGAVTATATFEVITSQVHYDVPPIVNATSGEFTVRSGAAHRAGIDAVSGIITFDDVNRGDVPTVKTKFASFKVLDAKGNDITSTLTAKELAAIAAVEVGLTVVASPGNDSAGSATWTYSVADRAFDFLGAGRKLVLTYQAQVDTNYVGYNTTVLQPFTITISSPHAVEWIHPSDGLWSVGSNWKTGLVPTALDDAIIPAQDIVGGTGHYAVTIAEAAFANSVTLDAADTTGAQLINNSTLTVSNALTLFNESAFYNFGTTNAGLIELLNQSSLHNSGLIKLTDGGDFIDQSSVSNDEAGILELAGGTLNVAVNVANAGLVLIDPAANLTLHGASINGSIENKGAIDLTGLAALINGTLDNFGHVNVSGAGNALHDEMVSNFGAIVVTGELTLDLGTTITGGVVSNAGTVRVESEQGATFDNVDVENLAGAIQVGSTPAATVLVVEDGTVINGGALSTGSAGTFEVAGASIATLGGVSVFNSGHVQVDEGSTLNLLGSTISGGFITDNGIIDVGGDSAINDAALNGGQVTVDATRTLTLDGTTVTGTTILDDGTVKVDSGKTLNLSGVFLSGGLIINLGLIDIKGDSSISDDTMNNSRLTIDDGTTLTLNGTIILGGIVTDDGIIHVTGDSAINNAAIYGGQIYVDDGYTLTLNGTTVTNTVIHDDGFIQIDVDKTRLLDGVAINGGTINNFGLLEIIGDSSISNDVLNNNQLTIDTGKTLTLSGTTIAGGIISDNGTIRVIGNSTINGNAELNGGMVTVDASTQLTLDNVTVTGTAIVDNGTVTVDAGSALDLSGVTLSGGAIDNLGLIDIVGDSSIANDTLTNANTLSVINNSILELTNTAVANLGGVVTVAAGSTLDLDSGASITDGTLGNSGEVNAEGTTALHHLGITNSGTLESTGGVLTIDAGGSISNTGTLQANGGRLELTNDTVTNSNALKAINNSILELTGTTVINTGGTVTVGTGSTLDLATSTITSGLVTIDTNGSIDLNGLAVLSNGSLSNSGQISVNSTGNELYHETVTANHLLEIMAGGALLIDQGSTIANSGGTVQVDVGGTLTLNSASLSPAIIDGGTVADYGTIYVINTVDISGNIIGTGAINIANLAELEIGGSVASGNTVLFTGVQGELILDQSNQFFGLITGSSVGTLLTLDDQIDLRDLSFNSNHMSTTVSYSSNVSTVTFIDHTDAGDISVQIRLSGDYTNQGWLFTNDGSGGSLVQLAPPPVFSDIIDNLYAFTGHKTAAGTSWTFQAAVTDHDATSIGQGGITKFDLYDNGTLFGSATFNGSAWTVSGSLMAVSYADGVYTITSNTTAIKNGDLLEITAYDAANLSASKSVTLKNESSFHVAPAGIAGEPINLALTDPSGGQLTGPIHLTLTGVPSDWSISEGTNLGNGTWTVDTNDLTALTVTTVAAYTGAMVLSVTETWTNADGSTGAALVLDNVEAYAAGSPIFALSGDDTLTGAVGNDLFVFAQPIGHDTVYSFDTGHDQIDLIGYAGFTSFADVQAHLTEDANGNALITLGDGQSIELQGVHAAALTQTDFVFDQIPTLDNAGTMTISDGAVMPLSGTINNSGTIALNSTGDETDLQLIEHGVTLRGGGQIVLSDSAANIISGTSSGVTLDNEDNTISGAGQLGNGELSLVNAGTIDATGIHALTIDTGANSVLNSGVLEASGTGGLTVASSIVNSGVLWANGSTLTVLGQVSGNGTALIDGAATLDLEASATVNVAFGSGGGTLKLGDSFHFNGTIAGFGDADVIDLANVDFGAASLSYHQNVGGTGGTLTISDGAHIAELSLVGNYSADNFSLAPDLLKGTAITYLAHDLVV